MTHRSAGSFVALLAAVACLFTSAAGATTTTRQATIHGYDRSTLSLDGMAEGGSFRALRSTRRAIQPLATLAGPGFLAAEEGLGEARAGQTVYRVWGKDRANPDFGAHQSGPWGPSWTRVDPRTVPGYRSAAGLPNDANLGRFLSVGRLTDTAGVTTRSSLRIGENVGGLDEVLIPNSARQVALDNVLGLNPPF